MHFRGFPFHNYIYRHIFAPGNITTHYINYEKDIILCLCGMYGILQLHQ